MEFFNPALLENVTVLAILSVVLLAVLLLLRLMFKMTASLFRLGCALIFLVVISVAILMFVI